MKKLYTERDRGRAGALRAQQPSSYRSEFRKDYGRLIHSAAFRRLQGKTQLFPGVDSEFFRNRLTHSIEVAQISKCIALNLNQELRSRKRPIEEIDTDLVEFAGLAHDLGHPPFGHEGEYALNELMRKYGGFEGNAQTLRIVAALEQKVVGQDKNRKEENYGLGLTYRSIAALLKYDKCIPASQATTKKITKGYYKEEAVLIEKAKCAVAPGFTGKNFKTLECSLMDVSDDIAYSTYDLEDSFKAGFLSPLEMLQIFSSNDVVRKEIIDDTNRALTSEGHAKTNFQEAANSYLELTNLSNAFENGPTDDGAPSAAVYMQMSRAVTQRPDLRTAFTSKLVARFVDSVIIDINERNPALSNVRLPRARRLEVELLKHLTYSSIIRSHRLRIVADRGREIVKTIFEAFVRNPALLPDAWYSAYMQQRKKQGRMRCICDFVACLTDRDAVDVYARLRSEEHTTIFKPLG